MSERSIVLSLMMTIRVAAVLLLFTGVLGSGEKMAEPRYADGNQLLRPEGYRKWMFAGSSLGMGYTEGQAPRAATFHNIYIQPEAFRQYEAKGTFPDKTILVMEVIAPGTNASINRQGQFEDRFIGIETAVKDENRFPDKWAYFNFIGTDGGALAQSKAFPKQACWKCHNEHGAVDNVFVQFYPVLREARAAKK
jgi:cytochrome P460